MERMTSRDEDCVLVNGHALGYATIGELVQMAERLAAYEDMDSKRLRPGDTDWLSKMFYTRPKKPVPVTVDAIRCASTGSAIPVTIFSLSRQKNTTSTLETTKMPDVYISRETALMKLMQDGCSAKTCNPSRICPPPTLRRWCGARTAGTVSMQRGARDMRAAEQLESIITQILDAQPENREQPELQNERLAV